MNNNSDFFINLKVPQTMNGSDETSVSYNTNKSMRFVLFIIMVLLAITVISIMQVSDNSDAAGSEFSVGDYRYVTTSSTTVEVLGPVSSSITKIEIPETVTYVGSTYNVVSIGKNAFKQCSSVTSISIPKSVTSIGEYAFAYCSKVTKLYYDSPSLTSSSDNMFAEIGSSSGSLSVTFGPNVTKVPQNMFHFTASSKNNVVKSVTFEGNVTSIGECAFYNCSTLTSIKLPDSITDIGAYAFYNCSTLTSIKLPGNLSVIGAHAFSKCSALSSISIPANVTSIGEYSFESCSSLTSITIPENVTYLGNCAFYETKKLSRVTCNAISLSDYSSAPALFGYGYYSSGEKISLTFGNKVTSIPNYFASGSSRISTVEIPGSVKKIGDYAFDGVDYLSKVAIYGIPSLGTQCFSIGDYFSRKTIEVESIAKNGFLDGYCGSYTTCTYIQLPHVSIDLDGKSLTAIPNTWFLSDGCLLKYYPAGAEIIIPQISAKGYVFKGLTTDPEATMPDYTLIYHAVWEATKITIKFDSNGGSGTQEPMEVEYNQSIILPSSTSFVRSGYSFVGWSKTTSGTKITTMSPTEDMTVYALWKKNTDVMISFNANGGMGSQNPIVLKSGTSYTLPKTTTFVAPTNKVFIGWSKTVNGSTITSIITSGDMTLYAIWSNNYYYKITLKKECVLWNGEPTYLSGGTVSGDGNYAYGTTITLKATPMDGWKFVKWSDGNTAMSRSYKVTSDATLTATFSMIDQEKTMEDAGKKIGSSIIMGLGVVAVLSFLALIIQLRKR